MNDGEGMPTEAEWLEGRHRDAQSDAQGCAIRGCGYWPIDERGPIHLLGVERGFWVCQEHWEGIMRTLGQQVSRDANDVGVDA